MSDEARGQEAQSLASLQEELFTRADEGRSGRAARTVFGDRDTLLRQTMLVLLAGEELAEHDSPPEASLHVLDGRVTLSTKDHSWDLRTGDFVPIPPERHGVTALEDSAFLLTARRAVDTASNEGQR